MDCPAPGPGQRPLASISPLGKLAFRSTIARAVECLSENTIQELVAGALSGEAHARAHWHAETCATCRVLVIELARDHGLAATFTAPAPNTPGPATRALSERFEIVRPLGRGGMGMVYEAIDRERGVRVALKTLQHVSADSLLRFKTEFRAVQDVHHPNLVTLGELIEERGQWWLTMELVDGARFVHHVRSGGQLDERLLRAALPQLAGGLSALHAHGLVHRDVKPHNVLVTPAGRVVLLDFGLVAGVAQSESNVVGTPAYMAPEQGQLREIGPAADWYGVGVLLYEALTGVLPFTGSPLQVLLAKQHELPRRPRELARVPEDLEALCMRLLAIEPDARLAAATALAELEPMTARPSPPVAPGSTSPFVGRHRELASLADAFAATRAGVEAIVLIEGESGIGKSALVSQFIEDLRRRDPAVRVLAGRCYERETVPYKGVDGVIDALARMLRKLPEAELAAVLPRRAGLLLHAFPVLGKVAALRTLPADEVVDRVELRLRAFTALRELLGRLAERGPLVVWIDDLQWADSDSLELLAWVMARPEAPPLLLLLTSRPAREPTSDSSTEAATARVRALPGLHQMELSPLPRDEAVALAERLLAENPGASLASAAVVADEAAGHPLFIDTLVRHTAVRVAIQPSLRLSDALWARISEVDPPARQLLSLIAIAGWPLPPEILITAAVLPPDDIAPALARLRQAHLVRAADHGHRQSVEPYHDRVREAVLDHLAPDQRKACHRAFARALLATIIVPGTSPDPRGSAALDEADPSSPSYLVGPEAVAVHLQAAGDLEQAAHYMVLAADEAAEALAFDCAARLYREALAILDEIGTTAGPADTRGVLTRLARALVNACRGAEAAAVYFELARRAKAAGEEDLELRLRGAEQLLRSGHRDDGWRALVAVCDELGLRPAATRVGALWRLLWRRAWVRLRGFASPVPDRQTTTSPRALLRLEACQVAWMLADMTSTALSADYRTRYQVLAVKAADPRCTALALVMEVHLALLGGNAGVRRAARLMDELAVMVKRNQEPYLLGIEQITRSFIELALGQWARGREYGAQATQIFRERCRGASLETALAAVRYAQCLFYLGALRDSMRELLPLWREAEERDDFYTLALHAGNRSLLMLVHDQPGAARQLVERRMTPWTVAASEGDVPHVQLGRIAHAEIDLYEGDGAAAYQRIDHDWHRQIASPFARLAFVRARMLSLHGLAALVAYQSGKLDRRLVRAAVRDARSLRAMRMPWTRALARILEAGVALATGARQEARELFERAHAELSTAGMNLHATLARRRFGELAGGAEGARIIADADAQLAAQDIRAPERFARLYLSDVT